MVKWFHAPAVSIATGIKMSDVIIIITSAEEGGYVFYFGLSVCLSVRRITEKKL